MEIKDITKECVRRSSVKTLPRIMNSHEMSLRALWIVGFLALFGICFCQVWVILQDYFEYSLVMTVSESKLDLTKNDVEVPNIMICNLNPVESNANFQPFVTRSVEEFLEKVEEVTSCENKTCSLEDEFALQHIKQFSTTYVGYFGYIGLRAVKLLGHKADNLIADCVLHIENGGFSREIKCAESNITVTRDVLQQEYAVCTSISFYPENYNYKWAVTGLSLVLHLDNFNDQFKNKLFFDSSGSVNQGSGALISLYEPGTFPMITTASEIVSAGMATRIGYQIETTKILNEPYGSCDQDSTIFIFDNPYKYTEDICRINCASVAVFSTCGCIHAETSKGIFLKDAQFNAKRVNLCFNLNERNFPELMANYDCLRNLMLDNDLDLDCYTECPRRCQVHQYSSTVSAVKWPRNTQYKAIYESILADKTYAWRYKALEKDCTEENCSLAEQREQEKLIESNLAKVNIFLKNDRHITSEETPKTSFSILISQLGATLNLWCGITLVIIIEFFEYIILLFLEKSKLKRNVVRDLKI